MRPFHYSLVFLLVHRQLSDVICHEVTAAARAFIVHLENMSGESLRAGGLVVTKGANKRFQVGVEVALKTPIVNTRPVAVAARISLLLAALAPVVLVRRVFRRVQD